MTCGHRGSLGVAATGASASRAAPRASRQHAPSQATREPLRGRGGAHQSLRLTGPSTVAWGTRVLLSGVRGAVCTRLCRGGSSAKPCRVHVLARATWSPSAGPSALAVRHWLLPRPCPRPRGASQAEQLWLQPLRPGMFIHVNIARNPGHVTGARAGQRGRTFARRPPPGGHGRRREGACGKASLRARRPAG